MHYYCLLSKYIENSMEVSAASTEAFRFFMAVVGALVESLKAVEDSARFVEVVRESYENFQPPSPWNLPRMFPVRCSVDSSMEVYTEASEEL